MFLSAFAGIVLPPFVTATPWSNSAMHDAKRPHRRVGCLRVHAAGLEGVHPLAERVALGLVPRLLQLKRLRTAITILVAYMPLPPVVQNSHRASSA